MCFYVCVCIALVVRTSVCACVCACASGLAVFKDSLLNVHVCLCVCVCNVPARRTSLFCALVAVGFTFIFWPKLLRGNEITLWYQS